MNKRFAFLGSIIGALLITPFGASAVSLYVDDAGDIGMGNDSPAHRLDVSGSMYSRLFSLPDDSTISVDWDEGNVQKATLGGNRTLSFSNGQAGGRYTLILTQDESGGRTVTWPNSVVWPNDTEPTLTTTEDNSDLFEFVYDGSSYLLAVHSPNLGGSSGLWASDNFNSYPDGDLSGENGGTGWDGAWTSSTENYQVQGTTTAEGAKAVMNASNNEGNIQRFIDPLAAGSFSVAMRRTSTSSGHARFTLDDGDEETQYIVEMNSSGNIVLRSTSGNITIQSYDPDTWYTIELQVDTAEPEVRARVNGGTWTSWVAPAEGSGNDAIERVYLDQNNQTGTNYWDTVTVIEN